MGVIVNAHNVSQSNMCDAGDALSGCMVHCSIMKTSVLLGQRVPAGSIRSSCLYQNLSVRTWRCEAALVTAGKHSMPLSAWIVCLWVIIRTLSQSYLSNSCLDQFCLQSFSEVYVPGAHTSFSVLTCIATNVVKSFCMSDSFWISAY